MTRPASIWSRLMQSALGVAALAAVASVAPFGAAGPTPPEPPTAAAHRPLPAATTRPAPCDSGEAPCSDPAIDALPGIGFGGVSLTPEDAPPRTGPVPSIPGAREIARFRSAGLTLFLDRPADPDVALELAAVAFDDSGWRRAPDAPAGMLPPGIAPPRAAAGSTYVRGNELAVVTLDESRDPMLLVAYYGAGTPSKDAP